MALNIMMRWDGVRQLPPEHVLDGRAYRPDQCTYHSARQQGASVSMTQTWRTGDAFETYLHQVLQPAMTDVGAQGEPHVVAFAISDLFLPRTAVALPPQRTGVERPAESAATPTR